MTHVNTFSFLFSVLSLVSAFRHLTSTIETHGSFRLRSRTFFWCRFFRTKKTSIFSRLVWNKWSYSCTLTTPFFDAASTGTRMLLPDQKQIRGRWSKWDAWPLIHSPKGNRRILFSLPEDLTVPSVRRAWSDSFYSNNVDFNRSLLSVFSLWLNTRQLFVLSMTNERTRKALFVPFNQSGVI